MIALRFYTLSILFALITVNAFAQNSVVVIPIKAVAGLKYDPLRFKVKPGATVRLVLTNADDMSHNLLITQPGAREEVVKEALALGDQGPSMSYIPVSSKILWSIPLVDPGQTKSVTFKAPEVEGVYPYVCTFPGHGYVMYGAMYVTTGAMPSMKDDPNIPRTSTEATVSANDHQHENKAWHPYKLVPPYLYRILMPEAGPAAIAVHLPGKLSYCWDAGACRLRYAWQGDFINPLDYWDKKAQPSAKILGTVFYRDKTAFPFRFGSEDQLPIVKFKGYRLIKAFPEFHYTLNGTDVFEIIYSKADSTGLERTFQIPNAPKAIRFIFDPSDGVHYSSSAGKITGNTLYLTAEEAKQFTITMTKVEGGTL
jgi:plastocyanin